jgi:hypothetical protein
MAGEMRVLGDELLTAEMGSLAGVEDDIQVDTNQYCRKGTRI